MARLQAQLRKQEELLRQRDVELASSKGATTELRAQLQREHKRRPAVGDDQGTKRHITVLPLVLPPSSALMHSSRHQPLSVDHTLHSHAWKKFTIRRRKLTFLLVLLLMSFY